MIVRRTILIAALAIPLVGGSVALLRRWNAPALLQVASPSVATAQAKAQSAGSPSSASAGNGVPGSTPLPSSSGPNPPKAGVATRGDFRKGVMATAPGESVALASTWNRFQSRLARCAEKDAPSAVGGSEAQVQRAREQTVILLDLEYRNRNMEVVDVSFPSRSGVSDAAMGCAVRALRGQVIPSSTGNERGGTRVQIPFPMQL